MKQLNQESTAFTNESTGKEPSRLSRALIVQCAAMMAVCGSVYAQSIAPAFSVGRDGESGLGTEFVYTSSDILNMPTAFAGGSSSNLGSDDAINGFSQRETLDNFLFCFSVDQSSTGLPGLLPMVSGDIPQFNVTNQAANGQQAGDAFLTTEAFNRFTGRLNSPVSMGQFNNVLAINQSQSYISSFGLLPNLSPDLDAQGALMDDIQGGGSAGALTAAGPLYFTVDQASTAFNFNDIIVDTTPLLTTGFGGDEGVFASANEIGIGMFDDIDAVSVFDLDNDNVFSDGDQIFFSLARGSALLSDMGWSAADILTVRFGDTEVSVFAEASTLGLLESDELDMLELVPLLGTAENTIIAKTVAPTPGSIALLGLSGLMASRRRRHS
jgi:hypothetical protein